MEDYKKILKNQIWEFYKWDMQSCINLSKIKTDYKLENGNNIFPGGLNFTSALLVFCIIEMMAAYYKGKELNRNGYPSVANEEDVSEFLEKYFSKYSDVFKVKERCKLFFRVFRHGLVHSWSPKGSAIGMNPSPLTYYDKEYNLIVLNVPPFYEITLKAFGDFENDLDQNIYKENFNKHLKIILQDHLEESEKLKKALGY